MLVTGDAQRSQWIKSKFLIARDDEPRKANEYDDPVDMHDREYEC